MDAHTILCRDVVKAIIKFIDKMIAQTKQDGFCEFSFFRSQIPGFNSIGIVDRVADKFRSKDYQVTVSGDYVTWSWK